MNTRHLQRPATLILALVTVVALLAAGAVFAQSQSRAVTDPATDAELAAMEQVEMPLSYIDGVTPGLPPDENPPADAAIASPSASTVAFDYYQVSGATLRGRDSTATYTYQGVGCTYSTDADQYDRLLNTDLSIPDGSIIKYLRLYYYDTSTTARARGYVTYYIPGSSTHDLITINNTAMDATAPGYSFVVSNEITHTVNNTTNAYTMIGWPSAATSNIRICGLRVAYYSPSVFAIAIPFAAR